MIHLVRTLVNMARNEITRRTILWGGQEWIHAVLIESLMIMRKWGDHYKMYTTVGDSVHYPHGAASSEQG